MSGRTTRGGVTIRRVTALPDRSEQARSAPENPALPEIPVLERDPGLRRLERAENFPVALRVLPRRPRTHLRAVYDVARVIDDLGDEPAADRSAPGSADASADRSVELERFRRDLHGIWQGRTPRAAVLRRLEPTVRECRLPLEPFDRLIAANLQDQRVTRYRTYADLRAYCALSAEPVGRLVLAVFDVRAPDAPDLSDRVCTALQLLEHCQDVAEDFRRGRVYLPVEDLRRFGVSESDLAADPAAGNADAALRRLVRFQACRAERLLAAGRPLVRMLSGAARLAVSGYVSGGLATADALRRNAWNVLPAGPRPRRRDVLRHTGGLLLTSPGSRAA
jgi:squalene synthase HpnC